MQKKIFVQKGGRSGGGNRSFARLLLWAAVGLMVLVLIAPLFSRRGKENREVGRKPDSEKGIVVKEIPRSLELLQPDGAQKQAPATDASRTAGSEPSAGLTPTPGPAPIVGGQPASPGASVPGSGSQDDDKTQPWVEMPKSPSGESPAAKESTPVPTVPAAPPAAKPGETPSPRSKAVPSVAKKVTMPPAATPGDLKKLKPAEPEESKTVAKATGPDTPAKPAPPKEAVASYAVQVGSFKDKQNAEEMQQNLQKRGYQVQMKSTMHPKLGQIYVVQLAPVSDVSKASTQVEQIKHEEKVKPMIIKIPQGP